MVLTQSRMWQMQQESFITKKCSKKMAGRSRQPGMNFIELLDTIQASGQLPLYFGFKDTWTCLAPWNAMACDLSPADVCQQVNKGDDNFFQKNTENLPTRSSSSFRMHRMIHMHSVTTMPALLLQEGNLQCTVSEATQFRRFCL